MPTRLATEATQAAGRGGLGSEVRPEPAWRGGGAGTQLCVLTARSLRAVALDPRLLLASSLGPVLILLVFSQIFAGIATTSAFPEGTRYIDFLVPAIMVTTAIQSAVGTGNSLALEMRDGIIARFRSMPIWPGSVLVARSLADLVRTGVQLAVMMVSAALLFGFRPAGGMVGACGALAVAVTVGGCMGWIFIALACWIRSVELLQSVTGLVTFPLMFASNAFVPTDGLPRWLRAVAELNPVSYGIDAVRSLVLGQAAGLTVASALGLSLVVGGLGGAAALRGFNRPI
ncbi:ABC transporter permease [Streptomyces milbemycinicus]|uniref:Transport permease protein n=1 Tax=Streptomyces milbemycinicus TaxID=476552 RepID=A0ABW8LS83_9ACTN